MTAPRGVLDANLIASGLVSSHGPGSSLITAARIGRFVSVVSEYLLNEVRETLVDDFHQDPTDVDELVTLIERVSERGEPTDIKPICRDPDDDPILALARESDAVFLATYDHGVMAVGSIGACGIIHPSTALQLVSAAAAEDLVEGVPGVSTEDRSQWRYEDFGPALIAAVSFIEWARQLPANPEAGTSLTTHESWPRWRQAIADGTLAAWMDAGWGLLTKVRYPADGMAFVFCPSGHPEETEPVLIEVPTALKLHVITLLDQGGEWKVHTVGPMVAPADVGRVAYSW